jgi:hypothetical protein
MRGNKFKSGAEEFFSRLRRAEIGRHHPGGLAFANGWIAFVSEKHSDNAHFWYQCAAAPSITVGQVWFRLVHYAFDCRRYSQISTG